MPNEEINSNLVENILERLKNIVSAISNPIALLMEYDDMDIVNSVLTDNEEDHSLYIKDGNIKVNAIDLLSRMVKADELEKDLNWHRECILKIMYSDIKKSNSKLKEIKENDTSKMKEILQEQIDATQAIINAYKEESTDIAETIKVSKQIIRNSSEKLYSIVKEEEKQKDIIENTAPVTNIPSPTVTALALIDDTKGLRKIKLWTIKILDRVFRRKNRNHALNLIDAQQNYWTNVSEFKKNHEQNINSKYTNKIIFPTPSDGPKSVKHKDTQG